MINTNLIDRFCDKANQTNNQLMVQTNTGTFFGTPTVFEDAANPLAKEIFSELLSVDDAGSTSMLYLEDVISLEHNVEIPFLLISQDAVIALSLGNHTFE